MPAHEHPTSASSSSSTPDPELRDLLRSWEVERREDAELARRVWARLEQENRGGLALWWSSLSRLIARPAAVVAAAGVFAVAGAVAAELGHARARQAEVTRLAAEYAQTIDPILMTHSDHGHGHDHVVQP